MREVTHTWRDLLLCFRVALDLKKLLLGLGVLLTTALVVALTGLVFLIELVDRQNALEQQANREAERNPDRKVALDAMPAVPCGGKGLFEIIADALGLGGVPESSHPAKTSETSSVESADLANALLTDSKRFSQLLPLLAVDLGLRRVTLKTVADLEMRLEELRDTLRKIESAETQEKLQSVLAALGESHAQVQRKIEECRAQIAHAKDLARHEPLGLVLWRVIVLAVACVLWWGLVSRQLGAISRIVAVELARDVRIELARAAAFARSKARTLFWAPVFVAAAGVVMCALIALWGLIGSIPLAGPLIAMLTSPFALLLGFLLAILTLGGVFGAKLLVPAIAVEGTDTFDAVSRSFSYVFSRPWHYVAYTLVGLIYGAISIGFVWGFTLLMLLLTAVPARAAWGDSFERFLAFVAPQPLVMTVNDLAGGPANPLGTTSLVEIFSTDWAMGVFSLVTLFGLIFVIGLALAYAVSYVMTHSTMMYLLLRRRVDGTDISELFYDEENDLLLEPPATVQQAIAATAK